MDAIKEFFATCVLFLYYVLDGTMRAVLPLCLLPKKSIQGRLVLITGTGSGLGRIMAEKFGTLGARLVLWDVNEKLNKETKQRLDDLGVESFAYTVDLSDRNQIYRAAEMVKRDLGHIDILINNAGIVSGKKLFDCPDDLMEKTMAVNAKALFYTAKAFLPAMFERNSGHFVTIASMAGHIGVNGLVDYCASKYAAVGFSEALRSEISRLGKDIPVTIVSPYYIRTGMFTGIKDSSPLMFPILEPGYVVDRIVEAVLTNAENVFLPRATYLYLFVKGFLPTKAMLTLADYYGLNRTMEDYIGRNAASG